MALFGSDSKNSTLKQTKIRPVVLRTHNVAKEIIALAKSSGVKTNSIDFNILEVQTFVRENIEAKEVDWTEVAIAEIGFYEKDGAFLDKNFEIMQTYEVELFSKSPDDIYKDLHLAIGANASKCKVYLSIKEGSKITYSSRFESELNLLIDKSKVRANILVDVFDDMQTQVIAKVAADARVKERVEFSKSETYLIAQSYEPTPTTDDKVIIHFEEKNEVDENDKVDYADRDFIHSVKEGELLVEYIKSKDGKPGRNCRGEFIEPREPAEAKAPSFTTDATIRVIETEDNIEYVALENGYIVLENGVYIIKSEVDVGEISFKTTGSIKSGKDSDVTITVKEKDSIKDAIGTGMNVEVSEIDIEGNVGSNAKVIAQKATIGGQTHKTSMIRADELKIHVHKGEAYGKKIAITRLEHGVVDGDVVKVSQAMGGTIRAKEIKIEICGSHVEATASKFIEITKLQGSENTFIIDSLLKKNSLDGFGENQDEIKKQEDKVNFVKKEIDKYTKLITDNQKAFMELKKRLAHYQKNGVKMPLAFVKQYKNFKSTQEHLAEITKDYEVIKDKLALLTTRTASFQNSIFDARIINRDRWVGYNEIIFRLVEPPVEVIYKPQEGSSEKIFAVVESADGEYKIVSVKE